jgi:hypothetical protein
VLSAQCIFRNAKNVLCITLFYFKFYTDKQNKEREVMKKVLVLLSVLMLFSFAFGAIDWCGNIWPTTPYSVNNDVGTNVYISIWKDGVTNVVGPGAGISARLYYKESSQSTFEYVEMTFNVDKGNDDEYVGTIPVEILNMGSVVNYYCGVSDNSFVNESTGTDQLGTALNESSPGILNVSKGSDAMGWYEDYISISKNGSGATYYLDGSGTALNGYDFGAVTSLSITGCDMKYWSNTVDRAGGSYFWQIKDEYGALINSGADPYDANEVIWSQSDLDGNIYQGTSTSIQNILTGLEAATSYQLHIWAKSWDGGGGQGDSYLNNYYDETAHNYVATFTTPDGEVPVTLASFTAEALKGKVELAWVTESEAENSHFLVYRDGEVIGRVEGNGTTTETHNYSFVDDKVVPGVHEYALADVTYGGVEELHESVEVEVKAEVEAASFALNSAYPNPFNPDTRIEYYMSRRINLRLGVYNLQGEKVADLYNGIREAGTHTAVWDATGFPSGIYVVRMMSDGMLQTMKVVLMK